MRQTGGESVNGPNSAAVDALAAIEMGRALKDLTRHPGLRVLKLVAEGLSCWRSSVAVEAEALAIGTSLEALGAPLEAFI